MKHTNRTMLILIIILFAIVLSGVTYLIKSREQNTKLEQEVEKLKSESMAILKAQPPEIIEVCFKSISGSDLLKDGWVTVGEDDKAKIIIKVEGNCTSLDMFIAPTGTGTYVLQTMITSLTGEAGQNEFEYVWNVPKGTIGHFWIIAYNGSNGRRTETFNIYNE